MYTPNTQRYTNYVNRFGGSRTVKPADADTDADNDNDSFTEVKQKKRSRQTRGRQGHRTRDQDDRRQENTNKSVPKDNDLFTKYQSFFKGMLTNQCLAASVITNDMPIDETWDNLFSDVIKQLNVTDEDFVFEVEAVPEVVLPTDICFTNTFLISTKRSSKPEINVGTINDVSYPIVTPEKFWSYVNRICGSRDVDRCTESDALEKNLVNRCVRFSETRDAIGKYNSYQRTTKVSIIGSPGTEFTKNTSGEVNNIFTINIRDLDRAKKADYLEVCSPDMRTGYLPLLLADFVGGGLPAYVRAVSYHPTIVIHRNGTRNELYSGYRIAIYLVEPSAEMKVDCERFFADTDPDGDCFQRLRPTPHGETYLRDLVETLKPRYS